MRINNKRVEPTIKLVYWIAIMGILIALFLYYFPIDSITKRISPKLLSAASLLIILIIRYLGSQKFEYDSDGEALNFKTQDVFLATYSQVFIKTSDFPKKKLISYKITGSIKKTLHLVLTSKRSSGGNSKLKYNVTYLNHSEIRDLKKSLKKIVSENKTTNSNR